MNVRFLKGDIALVSLSIRISENENMLIARILKTSTETKSWSVYFRWLGNYFLDMLDKDTTFPS